MADDDVRPAGGSPSARGVLADKLRNGYRSADHLIETLRAAGFVILSLEAIEMMGDAGDLCTENVTGRVCPGCRCKKGASASEPREARTHPAPSTRGKEP
jgi:hypothetical protein